MSVRTVFTFLVALFLLFLPSCSGKNDVYEVIAIMDDRVLLSREGETFPLFVDQALGEKKLEKTLFTYAVINGNEYRIGDALAVRKGSRFAYP